MTFIVALHYSCSDETLVSYSQDIQPITKKACQGYCHQSWEHFTIYENLKEAVDNGLLEEYVVITRKMPYGPASITEEERALFAQWIEEGGMNN